jgi:hypothetical protein
MTNYNRCKDTHNHNSSFVIPLAGSGRKSIRRREIGSPGHCFIPQRLAAFLQETCFVKKTSLITVLAYGIFILQPDHYRTGCYDNSW